MRVRSNYPHFSVDGVLHEIGDEYELAAADELAFRLKDGIVSDAGLALVEPPPSPPAVAPDPA
ncbi:MAG TPA: hypothetical protein VK636_23630 [Gemmatimonadaceae bacterium]|nr:hypothetical protein [Gemmatimonadaceae bacterium]